MKWRELLVNPNFPCEFHNLYTIRIHSTNADAQSETDDWEAALHRLGVNEKILRAILDLSYSDPRFTKTARFWFEETVHLRGSVLFGLQRVSFSRMRTPIEARMRQQSRRVGSAYTPNEPSAKPASNVQVVNAPSEQLWGTLLYGAVATASLFSRFWTCKQVLKISALNQRS